MLSSWASTALGFETSVFRMRKKIRHKIHYWWNGSRFNSEYEPFVSSCMCCCIWCEED